MCHGEVISVQYTGQTTGLLGLLHELQRDLMRAGHLMSKGAEMENDSLAGSIAKLVGRHPALCYQMALDKSHILFHTVKSDFFGDAFLEVFATYNIALFDSIRLMIHYEKSLKAWQEIISEVSDKVLKDTLIMDYVHPVFVAACDLPNAFKDQLVRGCVKLATSAKSDYSYLREDRRDWFRVMPRACSDTPLGNKLCNTIEVDLYRSADATHFRKLHGAGMHDISQTLVSGLNQTISPFEGVTFQTYTKPFDLSEEIEVLDRQRLRMQNAYLLFGEYGDALLESLSGN